MKYEHKIFIIVVAAIVMLSVFVGVGMQSVFAFTPAADGAIKIVSLSTDKDIYHSNENVELFLAVYSSDDISEVLIKVSGVKSRKGIYFVSLSNKTNLIAGENKITFTQKLPACSGCAGINTGTYFINVSVAYDDEVVNSTHSIAITSNPRQIIPVNVVVEEARRMVESKSDNVTLLDVRTEDEYNVAHITGATWIPIAELSNRTEELNKNNKIVVYCRTDNRSTTASDILIKNGFKRVYKVLGGINAWKESGYAVASETTSSIEQPGFEAVIAIAALIVVAYRVRREVFRK